MQTARTYRLHVGLFGRRNAGKSSLLNALTGQRAAIVSEVPGTTTDPVEKSMELLPLGPVTFIDTAGLDDEGELGAQRMERTWRALDRADVSILVYEGAWGSLESDFAGECARRGRSLLVVRNKSDRGRMESDSGALPGGGIEPIEVSCVTGAGLDDLRRALLLAAPEDYINRPAIVGDLVSAGELVVLVTPIDKAAPKGRLIMPQVQSIRDLLDHNAAVMVVKDTELVAGLGMLAAPPALVVTDSQAFAGVSRDVPEGVPLTSFSILFARFQGDLPTFVEGALAIERLRGGDKVLVAEACAHHASDDDIGTVKIPRWLRGYVGAEPEFHFTRGRDLPEDLESFKLVIHCGACMWNRRQMLSRLETCRAAGVPVTNYGLSIAYSLGIFRRALGPFPQALAVYERMRKA